MKILSRVSVKCCRSTDDQQAGSFLKQRISMALQIGKAACVLGIVSDRDAFEEIKYSLYFKNLYIIEAFQEFVSSSLPG